MPQRGPAHTWHSPVIAHSAQSLYSSTHGCAPPSRCATAAVRSPAFAFAREPARSATHMPHERAQLLRMNAAFAWHSPRAAHSAHPVAVSTHLTHWPHARGQCLFMYAWFDSQCPAVAHEEQWADESAHGTSLAPSAAPPPAPATPLRAVLRAGAAVGLFFFWWHMSHDRAHSVAMSAHVCKRPGSYGRKG